MPNSASFTAAAALISASIFNRPNAIGGSTPIVPMPTGPGLETLVVHRFPVLVRAHDFDQVVLGNGIAGFAAQDVLEARLRAAFIFQTHEIGLGIVDPPARKGIDVNVGLVPGRDRDRLAVPFQEPLIDSIHLLDEGQLEMQSRVRDRLAHRFAELGHDHLLGLVHRVEAAENAAEQEQRSGDRQQPKAAALVHLASGGLSDSGRIGSSCFIESSMMIFGPIDGSTSPIVSR